MHELEEKLNTKKGLSTEEKEELADLHDMQAARGKYQPK